MTPRCQVCVLLLFALLLCCRGFLLFRGSSLVSPRPRYRTVVRSLPSGDGGRISPDRLLALYEDLQREEREKEREKREEEKTLSANNNSKDEGIADSSASFDASLPPVSLWAQNEHADLVALIEAETDETLPVQYPFQLTQQEKDTLSSFEAQFKREVFPLMSGGEKERVLATNQAIAFWEAVSALLARVESRWLRIAIQDLVRVDGLLEKGLACTHEIEALSLLGHSSSSSNSTDSNADSNTDSSTDSSIKGSIDSSSEKDKDSEREREAERACSHYFLTTDSEDMRKAKKMLMLRELDRLLDKQEVVASTVSVAALKELRSLLHHEVWGGS